MQRLAPNLPLMVARVGVELHLHTTFMHLLHDVASILELHRIASLYTSLIIFASPLNEHISAASVLRL